MEKRFKWSVGLITAPRKNGYYLDKCLSSLINAGWKEPTIFAEPNSQIPIFFKGTVIHRPKNYGDWTNWATGLFELLLSNPESDYFLMVEDDVIFCKDSKKYLEHSLSKIGPFGSLSLYTPSIYHKNNFQGFHNELKDHRTWSTVTVVMSRKNVISLFSNENVQKHRFENIFNLPEEYWCCNVESNNSIKDAVIGQWASKGNLAIYYHTPSLAEHIGDHSTITDKLSNTNNGRKSFDFVGEDMDLSSWIENPIMIKKYAKIMLL